MVLNTIFPPPGVGELDNDDASDEFSREMSRSPSLSDKRGTEYEERAIDSDRD